MVKSMMVESMLVQRSIRQPSERYMHIAGVNIYLVELLHVRGTKVRRIIHHAYDQ